MSRIAKLLLVATSLAPALGAMALLDLQKGNRLVATCVAVAAALLVFICYLIKVYAEKHVEEQPLNIVAVESTDKDALAFLIAYLFPLITGKFPNLSTQEYWLITAYVFIIIAVTIYHSNAFHFNPVLAMFGYHFYEVTDGQGMKNLLIARNVVRCQNPVVTVAKLADFVYLEIPKTGSGSTPSVSSQ